MRTSILAGISLALAAVLTVVVGAALDLGIESVALLGITAGAVVALVPDATPSRRLAAFVLGALVALVGFFVRAAVMPDTSAGRAITAGIVVALCVGVTTLSTGRLPLWGFLAGAATFVGAYESVYAAAPPRVLETSISTSTALLLCVGIGFLVSSLAAPAPAPARPAQGDRPEETTTLDEMMETVK